MYMYLTAQLFFPYVTVCLTENVDVVKGQEIRVEYLHWIGLHNLALNYHVEMYQIHKLIGHLQVDYFWIYRFSVFILPV